MSADVPTMEQEQQVVYRIDCDKHYTPNGAPPILVLRKESAKPPILILQGMQTYPPRTPVIRDERKDKSQNYILKDERIPPPNNHPATFPYMANSSSNYGESIYPDYQQSMMPAPPMNDQLPYKTNQAYPMDQSQDHSSFGLQQPSNLSYSNNSVSTTWGMGHPPFVNHNMYTTRPEILEDTGEYTQQEPYHWQTYQQQDPWAPSFVPQDSWASPYSPHHQQLYPPLPTFESNYIYTNPYDDYSNGLYSNRMEQMPMPQRTAFYPPPSSPWVSPYYDNRMHQQDSEGSYLRNVPDNYDPASLQHDNGRQPAFRVVNNRPRRSKSVSFAPLSDHVVA